MMKKFTLLILGSFIAIFALFFIGDSIKTSVPSVSVYKTDLTTAEDKIICSGKVEYKTAKEVVSASQGIIDSIEVSKGDTVRKGDTLFTVRSIENISSQASSVAEVPTDEIYEAIKKGDYSSISQYTENDLREQNTNVSEKTVEIPSPIDGEILDINKSTGDAVDLKTKVLTVVSGDKLCVTLPVNESKIADLEVGQKAKITGNGFKNSEYNGEVSYIAKVAQQVTTGTAKETAVEVKVDVEAPKEDIKQGYSAKCAITTNIKENIIIIPYEAICQDDDQRDYVYLYKNGKAEKTYITTGSEYENGVEVTKGIEKGDIVILEPQKAADMQSVTVSRCVVNNDV